MQYAFDPDSMLELVLVHTASGVLAAATSFSLTDIKKIDMGKYDHLLVIAANSGGSSACTITPGDADGPSTAVFPLDGTGGVPDFRMTFATSAFESRQTIIRTAGRRRYLQFTVVTGAGTGIRLVLYVVGVRSRLGSGQTLNTNLTPLTLT